MSQGCWLQVSPGATQMPQLGLQHTLPTLHVARPQIGLNGYWIALSHGV
jgi:hypothetical protein